MTSIEIHKDVLWSTPIQSRHDSGYEAYDTFGCDLDISPIRKKTPYRHFWAKIFKRTGSFNSDVKKVSNQLPLINLGYAKNKTVSLAETYSATESDSKITDSGLQSDSFFINSENNSLNHYLQSFPTDIHSDILKKYINSNDSKVYQPYKYICKEGLHYSQYSKPGDSSSELLDKNNNKVENVISIKRKNFSTIDFLHELSLRNCTLIISQILSYLSDDDLWKLSYVSRDWKYILFNDEKACKRRLDYINNRKNIARGPNKENRFQTKYHSERSHKSVFLSVINASSEVSKQPLNKDNYDGRFDSFCQEVKTLQEKDDLMKCPKCSYPSKIESGSKYCCTRNLCLHEFCKKCLGPYMDNHICSEPKFNVSLPNIIIGSKKSKKYLRRLKV